MHNHACLTILPIISLTVNSVRWGSKSGDFRLPGNSFCCNIALFMSSYIL